MTCRNFVFNFYSFTFCYTCSYRLLFQIKVFWKKKSHFRILSIYLDLLICTPAISGRYAVEQAYKASKEEGLTFAVAGRNESKLISILKVTWSFAWKNILINCGLISFKKNGRTFPVDLINIFLKMYFQK